MLATLPFMLLVMALVPPVWVALAGGADMDFLGMRLDFYPAAGPGLALAGSVILAAMPRSSRAERAFGVLAFLGFSVVVFVCWTAGYESEAIRVRSPGRPAQIGAVFVGVALLLARFRLSPGRVLRIAVPGLALGLGLTAVVHAGDRADLERRLGASASHARSPDVIVVLVDTLRADALGTYGASPSPSPFLDGLAERSIVFERAFSQAIWTVPSVSSLLSSLYPSSYVGDRGRTTIGHNRYWQLPDGMPWLPEVLRQAGYHTAAFVKNPYLQRSTRFERGFDVYEWLRGNTAEFESGAELVDSVLRWGEVVSDRRAEGREGSFFLYVHFMDPHVEYRPPAEFWPDAEGYDGLVDGGAKSVKRIEEQPGGPRPEDVAYMRALYRGEVAYLDRQVERLHQGLAAQGLLKEDTILALVADHGEQFFEHGRFGHGNAHRENLHVPFFLRAPGLAPVRVPEPVALIDLTPTLLDLLGIAPPEIMEGASLLARLRGGPPLRTWIFSESRTKDIRITGPDWALITGGSSEWFETADGQAIPPEEAQGAARAALDELRETHRRFVERPRVFSGTAAPLPADDDTARRLKALGYAE